MWHDAMSWMILINQYMIRHLPIIKPKNDIKDEIVLRVDKVIQSLLKNEGIYDDSIKKIVKEIDDLIFEMYSINKEEYLIISQFIS